MLPTLSQSRLTKNRLWFKHKECQCPTFRRQFVKTNTSCTDNQELVALLTGRIKDMTCRVSGIVGMSFNLQTLIRGKVLEKIIGCTIYQPINIIFIILMGHKSLTIPCTLSLYYRGRTRTKSLTHMNTTFRQQNPRRLSQPDVDDHCVSPYAIPSDP